MIGKRLTPAIGKIAGKSSTPLSDGSTSPRSPLELKSPRGPKSYDLGVVGLAIVAALEKSRGKDGEFLALRAVCNRNSNPAVPIPVNSSRNSARLAGGFDETAAECSEEDEEYTLVTCRGPDNECYTRLYCDGGFVGSRRSTNHRRPSFFEISPARTGDSPAYPDSGFLNSCHMCRKNLHGKDIYMYRYTPQHPIILLLYRILSNISYTIVSHIISNIEKSIIIIIIVHFSSSRNMLIDV